MRTGTVVYVAGAREIPEGVEVGEALARAGLDPAWTEVVGLPEGFHTPQGAALALLRRGAARVDLARAFFDGDEGIRIRDDFTRIAG